MAVPFVSLFLLAVQVHVPSLSVKTYLCVLFSFDVYPFTYQLPINYFASNDVLFCSMLPTLSGAIVVYCCRVSKPCSSAFIP
jgi:hypothetical protein